MTPSERLEALKKLKPIYVNEYLAPHLKTYNLKPEDFEWLISLCETQAAELEKKTKRVGELKACLDEINEYVTEIIKQEAYKTFSEDQAATEGLSDNQVGDMKRSGVNEGTEL